MQIRRRRPEDPWSPEDNPGLSESALPAFTPPTAPEILIATAREPAPTSALTAPVAAEAHASSIPVAQTAVAADSSGDSEPQVVSATLAGIRPTLVPTDTYASLQWHLDAINVEGVWDKYSGRGIMCGRPL